MRAFCAQKPNFTMKSMTGFGRASADFPDFSATIDISSVNKKGIEVFVSLPREWMALEPTVNAALKKRFLRGKFNVCFSVVFARQKGCIFANADAVKEALGELKRLCAENGAQFLPNQETLLKINDLAKDSSADSIDWQEAWEKLEPLLDSACAELGRMRETEGGRLEADLQSRLDRIENLVEEAEAEAKNSPKNYRQSLMEKLESLGLEIDLDDERVLKEVCIFADRCDVAEEITRLKSHIGQFRQIMAGAEDAVGRKLDFLCQEMGREINTTASKANNLNLTKITLELKNEMERVREQVQNIE